MKKFLATVGWIAYWLSWPLLVYYVRGTKRTRLLLMRGDQILVLKQWYGSGRWGLPGGGLHKNEDPENGLIREVREETGLRLDPKSIVWLGIKPYKHQGFSYDCYFYKAQLAGQDKPYPHFEIREVQWLDPSDLNSKNATPDVLTALSLAGDS